ncbi:MAG: sn-glycerol-3-phosphate ABC transporter ATP-binding protein UgpC [Saprospiraceae bacterium]|nr:sn-glycerol-3-phosphate ABC transporter ATP-binding protein UgpC [Saprospiraceae bacterium]
MAEVRLKNISKSFAPNNVVVNELNLHVADKEFVVLVGPSGCGKSTTLRMIAGLEDISSGQLYIDGKLVNDLPPKDRDIAMVFQNYALYPHMTVFENMAFGLKLKKVDKKVIKEVVTQAAEAVDMLEFLDRKPKALSGGQRQRVALGRAIVRNPKVFLFDEPLSNLDAKLRVQMRIEIARLQTRLGTTTIYVTHDQVEAMTMADRIAVLKDGILQQYDTPLNTYNHPKNQFVAGFIGSPSMNFMEVIKDESNSVTDPSGLFKFKHSDLQLPIPQGQKVILGIRPEDLYLEQKSIASVKIAVRVVAVEPMGNESFLHLQIGPHLLTARIKPDIPIAKDNMIDLYMPIHKIHWFEYGSGSSINTSN